MHCYKSSFESVVNDRINDSESQKTIFPHLDLEKFWK